MKSEISMSEEMEQGGAPESLREDIRQRLSMKREDKLGELATKHDAVIDRLRSLEDKLDTIEAAKEASRPSKLKTARCDFFVDFRTMALNRIKSPNKTEKHWRGAPSAQ